MFTDPAQLGGALGDRFDVVNLMSGLGTFDKEYSGAVDVQIPALEEALAAIEGAAMNDED